MLFFSDIGLELYWWSEQENNRIKASKLYRMALKYEALRKVSTEKPKKMLIITKG